jgi:hypothetical protein
MVTRQDADFGYVWQGKFFVLDELFDGLTEHTRQRHKFLRRQMLVAEAQYDVIRPRLVDGFNGVGIEVAFEVKTHHFGA